MMETRTAIADGTRDDNRERQRGYDRKLSPEERHAQTRTRIIEAAVDAYGSRPADEVTIDVLARTAKMARGTIYVHFASLEEVRAVAYRESMQKIFACVMGAASDAHADPFMNSWTALTDIVVNQPQLIHFLLIEIAQGGEPAVRLSMREQVCDAWVMLHGEHLAKGRTTRPITRGEASTWMAMFRGVVCYAVEVSDRAQRGELMAQALATFRAVFPYTALAELAELEHRK